jgi:hypothetical protein
VSEHLPRDVTKNVILIFGDAVNQECTRSFVAPNVCKCLKRDLARRTMDLIDRPFG